MAAAGGHLCAIGSSLGIGASDTNTTVYGDVWTPLNPIMATARQFAFVMLPFAAVAAWRTWVHAKRRLALGTSGWRGVGEAGACGLVSVLVVTMPGILTHPAQAVPYVLALGAYAVLCGLLIGLLLRMSALIVLKLTEPMPARGVRAIAVVIVVALGCSACSAEPTVDLPSPPRQAVPSPPPPPAANDIISRPFVSPLSAADAERILLGTEVFMYGGPSLGVHAYNVASNQPEAQARLKYIATNGRYAGQLYAMCGLSTNYPLDAADIARRLATVGDRIWVFQADVATERPVSELVRVIRDGRLWVQFRRLKDEARRLFDKTG